MPIETAVPEQTSGFIKKHCIEISNIGARI